MKQNTITLSATLMDAVRTIESNKRLAVVIDQERRVIGTLTDGDVRRSLLNGNDLYTSVTEAMNHQPVVLEVDVPHNIIKNILIKNNIRSIPLVDHNNKYLRTLDETELYKKDTPSSIEKTFTAAVIMAGGEGTRLRPLTEKIPKPMLEINGIPLLERQIRALEKSGVKTIYISINYLGQIIKDHFLEALRARMEYLNGEKRDKNKQD